MEIWSDDLEESETTTPTFCFLSHTPLAWGKVHGEILGKSCG